MVPLFGPAEPQGSRSLIHVLDPKTGHIGSSKSQLRQTEQDGLVPHANGRGSIDGSNQVS